MSKPLSETHPTLYHKSVLFGGDLVGTQFVQEFTVDVAEHEALKKQLFEAVNNYGNLQDEVDSLRTFNEQLVKQLKLLEAKVERLKKEHERLIAEAKNNSYTLGCLNGEDLWREEVERLKKDYDALWSDRIKMMEEVERLKKELECMKMESTAYDVGFLNGERRAMERVKEAISNSLTAYQVERKLGLGNTYGGEEEKR